MRRSKRHFDEWIDQLAAGDRGSEPRDAVAAFVGRLGSESVSGDPVGEALPGLLAAEARSVVESVEVRTRSGRTRQPLARKWRRRAMISTFVSTLLGKLAVATVAVAATTGGLAATDSLPDPAQQWVSDVVENIGIDIPSPLDVELPEQADGVETPELPEEASDTADAVVDTVFEGDPTDDGAGFGEDVSDTASDGAADVADDYTEGAGDQADDGDVADDYTEGAGEEGGGYRP